MPTKPPQERIYARQKEEKEKKPKQIQENNAKQQAKLGCGI